MLLSNFSMPLISIITPVFNTGEVFTETIASVLKQTIQSFEWIIVDDGSTDSHTLDLLKALIASDSRVRVIRLQQNQGLPSARNVGIKNATADYLFFLDGDDLIDRTFIEKAYLTIKVNPHFSFVNSFVIGFGALEYKWTGGFHDKDVFLKENRNTSCFLAKRAVFDSIMFNETMQDGCEDWDFWLNAASKGLWGYTIPEFLFYYRRSASNKWATLQGKSPLAEMQKSLNEKYATIVLDAFPEVQLKEYEFGYIATEIEISKSDVSNNSQTLICILPWLKIGGADQYNLNLIKGLKAKGWNIVIITTLKSSHEWEYAFKEVVDEVIHLANLGSESAFPALLSYIINSRTPKLLFLSNSMYGYYALPFLKLKFPNLPIVDYIHCEEDGWYGGGYPYFSALYSSYLDRSYTTSNYLKEWCVQKGGVESKIKVRYINVDTQRISHNPSVREKIRKDLNLDSGTVLILFVARLTEQKQPLVLLETLEKIANKGLKFSCVIIGDGPDKQVMLNFLKESTLHSNVKYLGSKSNDEVLQYMDAADIFFLPSKYEGIALSIFEAMAKSLVVVGAKVGGQEELLTSECGFLVDPTSQNESVDSYVDILSGLLVNPESIKAYGTKARLRVEQMFNLEDMTTDMHTDFLGLRGTHAIEDEAIQKSYTLLLNRMNYLEKDSAELFALKNSKFFKVVYHAKLPYRGLKKVYQKLKGAVNR
jgi:glycosyltransferase involved in cell wall biosynthesis